MRPARREDAARLEVEPYALRLAQPLATAHGVLRERRGFIVTMERGGLTGRGEASILPEAGTETFEQCARELRRAEPRTPAARHALEQARLDLDAQEAGVPLAKLLDRNAQLEVQCSALLSAGSMVELAREAKRAAAEGFRTLKLKVGTGDDFARAAVVRDAVGPSVKLRVDANGAWDRLTALRTLRELAPLRIELCEQPTADLRGVQGAFVTVAADELVAQDFEAALERAEILVLKPMVLGGLLRALSLARRAQKAGKGVVVTTTLDGAIARAGAAHLAAAIGSRYAAGLATGRLLEIDVCADPLAPRDGRIALPATPGLGLR